MTSPPRDSPPSWIKPVVGGSTLVLTGEAGGVEWGDSAGLNVGRLYLHTHLAGLCAMKYAVSFLPLPA